MMFKTGFWRKCRIALRCARFTAWALVLAVLLSCAWLNVIGLPDFLKSRLVTALQERGVRLEFSRMRLRFIHGLVCDNVRVGTSQGTADPTLAAREVQLRVNYSALLHRRFQVDGFILRGGKLSLAVGPNDALTLTNLQGQLRILPDDTWSLDEFTANFAGARFNIGGEIAHAPECRNWKMFATAKAPEPGNVRSSLQQISDTIKQIHFEGKTELNARLSGDARDFRSFTCRVSGRAPGVQTPWFSAGAVEFAVHVGSATNAFVYSDATWDFWTNLQPFQVEWLARGADLKAAGVEAASAECNGIWNTPEVNLKKLSARLGQGSLDVTARLNVASREVNFTVDSAFDPHALRALLPDKARTWLDDVSWAAPPKFHTTGSVLVPAWTNLAAGWHDEIQPDLHLRGDLELTNTAIHGVTAVDSLRSGFNYSKHLWRLPDLDVERGRTKLELSAEANEATEDFHVLLGGKLDPNIVRPFLTTSDAVHGFEHLFFRQPATVILDVAGNVSNLATLTATGRVVAADFAIRGQWLDSLTATLSYTNQVAEFYQPQLVRADGAEKFTADRATLDLAGQKLFIHGGQGHVLPTAVAEAIGPETAAAMAPYQFLAIPEATVDGCIPLKFRNGELVTDDADLQFNVMGTVPFRWRRFETPAITGTIHWRSHYLILTNVVSDCYSGTARGWGVFDVETPGDGTDFSFFMDGTNVDFNAMGKALWSPSNQLRGALSAQVMVTHANSSDWRTWDGYGQAQLQDGILWDAPVLGGMSKVLNTIAPGLDMGNSRATDGAGHFTMTNGVIFTDSLEIRSLTMRISYVGTVDLEERLSARAKAQFFRNTPVVGSLFSFMLAPVSKAFECEVTGTLDEPHIKPVYIPFTQVLTAPLHPIRTVEKIFSLPSTNNSP